MNIFIHGKKGNLAGLLLIACGLLLWWLVFTPTEALPTSEIHPQNPQPKNDSCFVELSVDKPREARFTVLGNQLKGLTITTTTNRQAMSALIRLQLYDSSNKLIREKVIKIQRNAYLINHLKIRADLLDCGQVKREDYDVEQEVKWCFNQIVKGDMQSFRLCISLLWKSSPQPILVKGSLKKSGFEPLLNLLLTQTKCFIKQKTALLPLFLIIGLAASGLWLHFGSYTARTGLWQASGANWFRWILGFFVIAALVRPGPDFASYQAWSRAIYDADLGSLHTCVISQQGFPFVQWSCGLGALLALAKTLTLGKLHSSHIVWILGACNATVFLYALNCAAQILFRENRKYVYLAFLLTMVGTPTGYYLFHFSSESVSITLFSLITYLAFKIYAKRTCSWWCLGVLASLSSMFVLIRNQNIVYLLPVLFIIMLQLKDYWKPPWSLKTWIVTTVIASIFFLCFLMIVQQNYWMSGKWYLSPYSFGYGSFKSLDLSNPKLFSVLFHPLHGHFIYTPLTALCILIALRSLFHMDMSIATRCSVALLLIAFFVSAYILSGWYVWWLGWGQNLGMRVLAPLSPPLCLLLVWWIQKTMRRNWRIAVGLIILAVAGSVWSSIFILYEGLNLVTYTELYHLVKLTIVYVSMAGAVFWTGFTMVLAGFFVWFINSRECGYDRHAWIIKLSNSLLITILIGTAAYHISIQLWTLTLLTKCSLILLFLMPALQTTRNCSSFDLTTADKFINASMAITCIAAFVCFINLAVNTYLSDKYPINTAKHDPNKICNYQLDHVAFAYYEYGCIPGFKLSKQKLADLLIQSGRLPPKDSHSE
jgi:hypothetical protein